MGVTFLGIIATVSIINGRNQILLGAPLLLCIMISYVLYLNNEAVSLGGYKSAIEVEVRRRAGVWVSSWETNIGPARHNDYSTLIVRSIFVILVLATSVAAMFEAWSTRQPYSWGHEYSKTIICGTAISIIVGILMISLSAMMQSRAHSIAAEVTHRTFADRDDFAPAPENSPSHPRENYLAILASILLALEFGRHLESLRRERHNSNRVIDSE